jgi:signal transduction histidine kinase
MAMAGPARNVLVLYSNNRLAPGNVEVDRGLRQALAGPPKRPVQIFSEFLDAPQFEGAAHERTMLGYLREKYRDHPPQVVVAFSDAAFDFLARQRGELFPTAPLVHGSVSSAVLQRFAQAPDVLGVPMEYDFTGTIEQALRWHPAAQRLVVITGVSSRDRGWERRLRAQVPPIAGGRRVEFWSGLPTPTLLRLLAALDAGTVVFTPGYYTDGDGAVSTPYEAAARIAQASTAPVYGPIGTFIGTGVVGGRMPSFVAIGQQAGEIVDQLLDGTPPSAIRPPERTPVVLHADWRQVERFGIDPATIPPDAQVHFRAPSFWQQYRGIALGGAAIIGLQAALIGALLLERRRRRLAETAASRQRAELAHASRLAVAGELTASIAHEINQPLGAVQTSADAADLLLQSEVDQRDDLRRIVTRIRRDSLRAGEVVRRLRQLLARHEPDRAPFEATPVLQDAVQLLQAEARRREVSLELRCDTGDARVHGDRTQIEQVLINLVLNAIDAVAQAPPERRVVRVVAEIVDGAVRVSVRDRGRGIAAGDLPKVFESFYSTKAGGMGLGLSIARTIVEAHDGRISVESSPELGTCFAFELPHRPASTTPGSPSA